MLLSIELENFRNFPALALSLDPRGAILEAPNGQGKTNFLEAIHYLSLFRSFRGAPDAELVAFGKRRFLVRGEVVEEERGPRCGVGVAVEGLKKRLLVNGRAARPGEHVGAVLSVVLAPSDIQLVQGSPSSRRRYLDVTLALCSRRYLRALHDYRRALRQRNRVLQAGSAAAGSPLLEPWTEQLVRHGSVILEERQRFLSRWGERFGQISARIAGAPEGALSWCYESTVTLAPGELTTASLPVAGSRSIEGSHLAEDSGAAAGRSAEVEAWPDALRSELDRLTPLERKRGVTLVGPHRDDLAFHAEGPGDVERDLRKFGSQGEQRTAALALRFLESEVLAHERGQLPIVLLDDVFSELDPERGQELLSFLTPGQQVFLTTPRPLALALPVELPRYRVGAGTVRAA